MALKKVAHHAELIKAAKEADAEGELAKAAALYSDALKQHPLDQHSYERLMILYRKLKKPKEELKVIDQALKVFQEHYDEIPKKLQTQNPKAAQLSKSLLKSLTGKSSAKSLSYYPEFIYKWKARRKRVEKLTQG
ncbi:MAG: hypothetical protein ACJ748_16270 [Flavisolibacter sp.]